MKYYQSMPLKICTYIPWFGKNRFTGASMQDSLFLYYSLLITALYSTPTTVNPRLPHPALRRWHRATMLQRVSDDDTEVAACPVCYRRGRLIDPKVPKIRHPAASFISSFILSFYICIELYLIFPTLVLETLL